jgi:putative transposase
MPGEPRMYLSGIPSHVVQRVSDRNSCFFGEDNYLFFLDCLKDTCRRYDVAIHAYVLTNHIHLPMTPSTESGISRVMQLVGNRYVQYINKKYGITGTL